MSEEIIPETFSDTVAIDQVAEVVTLPTCARRDVDFTLPTGARDKEPTRVLIIRVGAISRIEKCLKLLIGLDAKILLDALERITHAADQHRAAVEVPFVVGEIPHAVTPRLILFVDPSRTCNMATEFTGFI